MLAHRISRRLRWNDLEAQLSYGRHRRAMSAQKRSLVPYKRKRRFHTTPEPQGSLPKKQTTAPIFVIQKHAASHLHYDFRLEIDGVLVSWAVPKGIATDPAQKHLALQTEDHPIEYAQFEGVIPQGEYGGGTVMVWDIGTYENKKKASMSSCLKKGRIEIVLEGKKLKGGYALIRTALGDNKKNWLLVKMRDEYADKKIKNVTKSALTGRTMKQIAAGEAE